MDRGAIVDIKELAEALLDYRENAILELLSRPWKNRNSVTRSLLLNGDR